MEQGTTVFCFAARYRRYTCRRGIVHDERAGEPGKMGGEFVADTYVRRARPGTAIKQSTRRHSRNTSIFFIRVFLRIVFPRFYFSDRGRKKYSGRITVSLQRERRRKQYWRLADFQRQPAAAGFEDIAPAPSLRRSLYRRRFISSTPTSGPAGGGDAFGPNRHADGVVSD